MSLGNALLEVALLDEDPFPDPPGAGAVQIIPVPVQQAAGEGAALPEMEGSATQIIGVPAQTTASQSTTHGTAAQTIAVPTQSSGAAGPIMGSASQTIGVPRQRARAKGPPVYGAAMDAAFQDDLVAWMIDQVGEIVTLRRGLEISVDVRARIINGPGPIALAEGVSQQGRAVIFSALRLRQAGWEGPPQERDQIITQRGGIYTLDKVWPGLIGDTVVRFDCPCTGNIGGGT